MIRLDPRELARRRQSIASRSWRTGCWDGMDTKLYLYRCVYQIARLLRMLQRDGYLLESEGHHAFRSFRLRASPPKSAPPPNSSTTVPPRIQWKGVCVPMQWGPTLGKSSSLFLRNGRGPSRRDEGESPAARRFWRRGHRSTPHACRPWKSGLEFGHFRRRSDRDCSRCGGETLRVSLGHCVVSSWSPPFATQSIPEGCQRLAGG